VFRPHWTVTPLSDTASPTTTLPPAPALRRDEIPRFPDLAGKVAAVTGASAGIGAATARALAANGVRVVLLDMDEAGIDRVAAAIREWDGEAIGAVCDITSPANLAEAAGRATRELGPVELLMPFAGGFTRYTPIESMLEDEWRAVLDLNLTGTYLTIKAFLPGMLELGRGSIVTMSSSSARILDEPVTAPYAAAKAGVAMMTRHLAIELGPRGIRVNALCPATTRTERADRIIPPERQAELAARSPLGRMGHPGDVANAALYLASAASDWVTGICLDVAGGRVMM